MNKVKYCHIQSNSEATIPMGQEFNQTVVNVVSNQWPKIAGVWASIGFSIGIHTWSEAASFLAFVLSFCALVEYLWKKIFRPFCVRIGLLKPIQRRIKLVQVNADEQQ